MEQSLEKAPNIDREVVTTHLVLQEIKYTKGLVTTNLLTII